ncbi:hypothetical protein AVEN_92316-1 [Araneus ventricosus]|uniref:Uncharacterized protein n=1 Tax=Araneus ventricosus TaxID=182803 RepID=A0A4Y2AL38_ARAVE|nr:hypothetical protein AVEN_92316-1 [Araneus ventricosus]
MQSLIIQIAYLFALPLLIAIAGFIIVRSFCSFRNRQIQRNAVSAKVKSEARSYRKKKRDDDSVILEVSSDDTTDSSLSYSEKVPSSKHRQRDVIGNSKLHMKTINESTTVPIFIATDMIAKTASSEAFAQTENLERNIAVQADIVPKIYSMKTHRHQYVQTDLDFEKFGYYNDSMRRNSFIGLQIEKNFIEFSDPPLTDISTLHCNPIQKKSNSNNISNLEERAYRLSRWLSEEKDICKSNMEFDLTKTFPKMYGTRRSDVYPNYSIPNISNYFEGNRIIQKHYSPEDNYSKSSHDIDSHLNIFQTLKAPVILPHFYKDAVIETDQNSNKYFDLIPESKSAREIRADLSRRPVDRFPVEFKESAMKPIDYEFKRNMFDRRHKSEESQTPTNFRKLSHSYSSPDSNATKRTVYEIARRLEKRSPTPISPLKKLPQSISQKCDKISKAEKKQNSTHLESKGTPKPGTPKPGTPQKHRNVQIQKTSKPEGNHLRADRDFDKITTGENPNVKRINKFQSNMKNKYSPEKTEATKIYYESAGARQEKGVFNNKTIEVCPKSDKKQDSAVAYRKIENHGNQISHAKHDLKEKCIKSYHDLKATNFKSNKQQEDKLQIASNSQEDTLLNKTDQEGFADPEETAHDKVPVWKRAQLFSKIINKNDLAETGDTFASEQKDPDIFEKQGPIRVKKKFSNYLKGQYRSLEDETVSKSYMMIQDLKEVLQKRGICN